jgi:predicted ATPase with chaperone activity
MLFDDAKLNRIVELSKFLCNNLTKKLIIAIMVARTIADLEACADVLDHHIMEAIAYRNLDRPTILGSAL